MDLKQRVIEVARKGASGEPDIPFVLQVAESTDDRHLLRVCLDCFVAVLRDSQSEAAYSVTRFLASLLRDNGYRRIRRSVLVTLTWVGAASYIALPEILEVFKRRGPSSILVPSRWASISVPWDAILSLDPAARSAGVAALESLGSLGLLNLCNVPEHLKPDDPLLSDVMVAIARLETKHTKG